MSVRKRTWVTTAGEKKEAWVVDYKDREGDRHIETFSRKKDADARHSEVNVDVRAGTHVAPSKSKTVAEAAELWIEACKLDALERSTLQQYRGHVDNHIIPRLGRVKLSDLTSASVSAFRNDLRKSGVSLATTRKIMASLSSLIGEAQTLKLVAHNVTRDIGRKRTKSETRSKAKLEIGKHVPSAEEVTVILAYAKGRWRPLLLVAAFTGLRASELRGLRWCDVDLKANKLTVRQRADRFNAFGPPKSEAGQREVPFGPTVANTLKQWKLACPHGELVFPNTLGNVEGHANIIQRAWHPTQEAAGIVNAEGKAKYYGLHTLRHFYASWCISRGLAPKVIQTLLGHTSITMTLDRYGHLFPDALDADEIARAELKLVGA